MNKLKKNAMKQLIFCAIVCLPSLSWTAESRIDIARFSLGDLSGWQTKVFAGETRYALEKSQGRLGLRADSNATASGHYREININLEKTPMLNWKWKVDNVLTGIDERTRVGDDYAARVYVVFSGGLAFWRTRAINYVWSSNQPVGSSWPSAYTDNVRMIAVQSGLKQIGQWVNEKRNISTDYQHVFGEKARKIDAIAIMTDTDNSGKSAIAWYGDIWFTEK
jgi:hypothetical protein